MPVINTAKVTAACIFVNEMILVGFCPECSIRSVARPMNLNRFEVALLTDVMTVMMLERDVPRRTTPLHRHLVVVQG